MMNLFGGASRAITNMLVQMPDSDNEEDAKKQNLQENDGDNKSDSATTPDDESKKMQAAADDADIDPEKKSAEEVGINTTLIASMFHFCCL